MAKAHDPETGAQTKARDGVPSQSEADNELAQRKLLKEAREREEERQVAGNGGRSVDEQEPPADEPQEELFIYEGGRKVTLGTIIPPRTPVEHAIKFGSARRKGQGGLIGFEEDVLLVVRGKVAGVHPRVTRNDDESVKSVTVETEIAPKIIMPADSEQAMEMLAGVLEKHGYTMAQAA